MASALPNPPAIRTARDAAALCEPYFERRACEKLLVLHLASDRTLIHLAEGEEAAASHVDIPLRSIVADAIRLRTAGLIIAHCHPSGDPTPSDEDLAVTRRLAETTAALGIMLHDHLVFGGGECRSFRALGLL